jgi:hypothetical protein
MPRVKARRPALERRRFQRRRWRRRRLQERHADEGSGGGARTGLQGWPRYGEWIVGSGDRRTDGAPGVAGDDSFSFFLEKKRGAKGGGQRRRDRCVGAVGASLLACWEGGGLIAKTQGRIRGLAGVFLQMSSPPLQSLRIQIRRSRWEFP